RPTTQYARPAEPKLRPPQQDPQHPPPPTFLFNDTATPEIYTLSLHDALPILQKGIEPKSSVRISFYGDAKWSMDERFVRSEEHTSELQSHLNLVCSLLLE